MLTLKNKVDMQEIIEFIKTELQNWFLKLTSSQTSLRQTKGLVYKDAKCLKVE